MNELRLEKGDSFGWGLIRSSLDGGAVSLCFRHVPIPRGTFVKALEGARTVSVRFLSIDWTLLAMEDLEAICSTRWPRLVSLALVDSGIDSRAIELLFNRDAFPALISLDLEDNPMDEKRLQMKMREHPDICVNYAWWEGAPDWPRRTWPETHDELMKIRKELEETY